MFPTLREYWRRALLLSTLAAVLVCLAAMHARSITIAGVRSIDHDMLVASLSELRVLPAEARPRAVTALMAPLRPNSQTEPYVGMAIWEGADQLYADHSLLRDRAWDAIQLSAKSDPRYLTSILPRGLDTPEWRVSFFRPELGHNMSPWLFWLLPFAQLADPWSMEVQPATFVRKLAVLFPLTLIALFAACIVIESWHARKARHLAQEIASLRMRLRELDARIIDRDHKLSIAADAARQFEAALQAERAASEEITSAAAEREKRALERENEVKALREQEERDRAEARTLRERLVALEKREGRALPSAVSAEGAARDSAGSATNHGSADGRPARVLQALLPSIRFVGDSLHTLTNELPKPESAAAILKRLNETPGEVRAQAVASAKGWRELRFSTGSSNDGRIYFQNAAGVTHIYIGFKRNQERDIRRLKDARVP